MYKKPSFNFAPFSRYNVKVLTPQAKKAPQKKNLTDMGEAWDLGTARPSMAECVQQRQTTVRQILCTSNVNLGNSTNSRGQAKRRRRSRGEVEVAEEREK